MEIGNLASVTCQLKQSFVTQKWVLIDTEVLPECECWR